MARLDESADEGPVTVVERMFERALDHSDRISERNTDRILERLDRNDASEQATAALLRELAAAFSELAMAVRSQSSIPREAWMLIALLALALVAVAGAPVVAKLGGGELGIGIAPVQSVAPESIPPMLLDTDGIGGAASSMAGDSRPDPS